MQLLKWDDLTVIFNLSKRQLHRISKKDERFPRPVRIGGTQAVRFKESEINEYINSLQAAEEHADD